MKRIFLLLMIVLVSGAVMAQPKARRNEAKNKQQTSNANSGMTLRAREMFPTALEMPQDVVWKRDIYREIDLNAEANAALYYPIEPVGKQMNLFT